MKPGKVVIKARLARINFQARIGRAVTQKEAANAMGMDASILSRIEKGKTSGADWETLARMCSYYEIGICELMEYTEDDAVTAALESEDSPDSESRFEHALNAGLSSLGFAPVH